MIEKHIRKDGRSEEVVIVYPGHPLTIATLILTKYGTSGVDLAVAFAKHEAKDGYSCPNALADVDIPGAGDCVYNALDILQGIRTGIRTPEAAVAEAAAIWRYERASDYKDKLEAGEAEAKSIEGDFLLLARRIEVWGVVGDGHAAG
jgi:hypothetical protein